MILTGDKPVPMPLCPPQIPHKVEFNLCLYSYSPNTNFLCHCNNHFNQSL